MALVTERLLFTHVPKTGGSSVRRMIVAAGIKATESGPFEIEDHYGLPELRAAHPGIEDGRLTFGFVRHPVTWLQSRWAWAVITGFPEKTLREPAAAAHWMHDAWSDDFVQFAQNTLERHPGVATRTAFHMLGLWTDRPAQRIGRMENLEKDLIRFLSEAGHTFDVSAIMSSPREREGAALMPARCEVPGWLQDKIIASESLLCRRFYACQA